MRVSDIAEIAGVSVRTVRYYHAIGLLPVPPQHGAWRDYGFEHVARLVRIRVLANAGIPLAEIPRHLGDSQDHLPAELEDSAPPHLVTRSVAAIDEAIDSLSKRITELEAQRHRLLALRRQAEGKSDTALPKDLADTYDAIESLIAQSDCRLALALFQRERTLIELAAQLGFINKDISVFLSMANPNEIADFYVSFAKLPQISEEMCEELVDKAFKILEGYGELPPSAIDLIRRFAHNRAAQLLCLSAAPTAVHRRFVNLSFQRLRDYLE
ncbi:MerR family transcriptional regulator [Corynebacterium freiburgense]|uniref:MerR family transcriptional regulator n=1 Tax=Corynebacterium freiburgense TaxID=556548 RepID=UPI0004211B9F|nr:MerR family transcriptional regulator [Corynebacterium freiburgense]WJZ01727.1 DNA-binding transcriptional regulator CueR [Corynebacterium freiburgense]